MNTVDNILIKMQICEISKYIFFVMISNKLRVKNHRFLHNLHTNPIEKYSFYSYDRIIIPNIHGLRFLMNLLIIHVLYL